MKHIDVEAFTLTGLRLSQDAALNAYLQEPTEDNLRVLLSALHIHICQLSDACEQRILNQGGSDEHRAAAIDNR